MKTILFVCTGNTCRSTMAEALFKAMLERIEHSLGDVRVISAGTCAIPGDRASRQAVEVMGDYGISLKEHRTTPLTKELVEEADLVLAMTLNHKRVVLELCPKAKNKVYTLKEYVGNGRKIDEVLDEINEVYKAMEQKRSAFILYNQKRLKELKKKREKLLRELEEVEREAKGLEEEFKEEIEECEDRLIQLQTKLPNLDIADPFGHPVDVYRRAAKEIEENLQKLMEKLEKEK